MNNFTQIQIEKIKNIIHEIKKCNSDQFSNCKITNIMMYEDSDNNFYVSYTANIISLDGELINNYYFKIKTDGTEIKLNNEMNEGQIKEIFSNLKTILL